MLVRGGPFKDMLSVYPHPKCRFGSNGMITTATYVTCSLSPTPAKSFEKAAPRVTKILDNLNLGPRLSTMRQQSSLAESRNCAPDSLPYRGLLRLNGQCRLPLLQNSNISPLIQIANYLCHLASSRIQRW